MVVDCVATVTGRGLGEVSMLGDVVGSGPRTTKAVVGVPVGCCVGGGPVGLAVTGRGLEVVSMLGDIVGSGPRTTKAVVGVPVGCCVGGPVGFATGAIVGD